MGHYLFLYIFGVNDGDLQQKLRNDGLIGLENILAPFKKTHRTFRVLLKPTDKVIIQRLHPIQVGEMLYDNEDTAMVTALGEFNF